MKKIGITAIAFTGNQGAEAMLVTTIRKCRDKYGIDTEFYIFTPYPQKDKALIVDKKITILSSTPLSLVFIHFPFSLILSFFQKIKLDQIKKLFPKEIYNLSNLDVLIDLAGVSFIDKRLKFLPFNILTILPAIILNVPVIKMAQAMGPFERKMNRISAKFILNRCQKVFARGRETIRNLKQLDLQKDKFTLASDVALLNKESDSLTKIDIKNYKDIYSFLERNKKEKIIGICPSSVVFKKKDTEYLKTLIKISNIFLEKDWKVVLFPNANRDYDPSNLRNNDLPLLKEIFKRISNKNLVSVTNDLSTREIKYIIGQCNLILTSRFHAMIGALSKGVPPIVLGWSHKYMEIMEEFELGDWVLDYSNTSKLKQKVLEKINETINAKEKINKYLKQTKDLSQKQFDYLFDFLK